MSTNPPSSLSLLPCLVDRRAKIALYPMWADRIEAHPTQKSANFLPASLVLPYDTNNSSDNFTILAILSQRARISSSLTLPVGSTKEKGELPTDSDDARYGSLETNHAVPIG